MRLCVENEIRKGFEFNGIPKSLSRYNQNFGNLSPRIGAGVPRHAPQIIQSSEVLTPLAS